MAEQRVSIHTPNIPLDAFLKWVGAADSGGAAKALIQGGQIQVNGLVETRRGRKLVPGDRVAAAGGGRWCVVGEGG